jgi:lysozyme
MNEDRHLTAAGANLIKHFEGCLQPHQGKYRAYVCPAGVLTIGWGSTHHGGHPITKSTVWTKEECHGAFLMDMVNFEKAVRRLVSVALTEYQFDALGSFAYNCGEGNLSRSTLLKYGNSKQWNKAALEFHKWNKGGGKTLAGLTRRRASESLLFQGIPDADYDGKADKIVRPPPDPMPQAVDSPDED